MGTGDGWATCAAGHRHWGRYGAAGLLLVDGGRVILQHRAPWTHEGDTWGIPGGARESHEDPLAAALREAHEEARLSAEDVDPIGLYVDDHDGWSYTTVVARPIRRLRPYAANAESVTVRWHPVVDVATLPLHRGFAAAWVHLQDVPPPLFLVVGGAAADHPLLPELHRAGVASDRLPPGMVSGGLTRLLPHVIYGGVDAASVAASYAARGQVLLVTGPQDLKLLV